MVIVINFISNSYELRFCIYTKFPLKNTHKVAPFLRILFIDTVPTQQMSAFNGSFIIAKVENSYQNLRFDCFCQVLKDQTTLYRILTQSTIPVMFILHLFFRCLKIGVRVNTKVVLVAHLKHWKHRWMMRHPRRVKPDEELSYHSLTQAILEKWHIFMRTLDVTVQQKFRFLIRTENEIKPFTMSKCWKHVLETHKVGSFAFQTPQKGPLAQKIAVKFTQINNLPQKNSNIPLEGRTKISKQEDRTIFLCLQSCRTLKEVENMIYWNP